MRDGSYTQAMNKLKTTIALLLFFPLFLSAQYEESQLREILSRENPQELVTESSQMMQEGYLYQAGRITDKLLEIDSNSCNYNYRRGFIYLQMSGDFERALPHLKKSIADLDKNFDAFSSNEKSAPIDALFHLGRAYHLSSEIDNAILYFNKFIELSNPKSEFVFLAKNAISQCEVAKKLMASPKKALLRNIGSDVNTKRPEYSPVISLDGSALYFTTRRDWADGQSVKGIDPRLNLPPEDIYVSYKDFDSSWTPPMRMEFCDPLQNEASMSVSSDERRIYVYEDTRGNGDIFYSDFTTNRFQKVQHFDVPNVNTDAWEPHITVTPDGKTIYFVSDRKGGFGGRDIYRVVKLPTGDWSEPQNMGPTINTAFDEDSPFIAIDNKTLYFSSNCERSMGGFDVFVSLRDEDNVWSPPLNLGCPLNSTGDDLFYTTTVDGLTGYLTSYRRNGFGEKDIYEIKNDYMGQKNVALLKVKIKTVDDVPIPEDVYVSLKCENCGENAERKLYPRVRDGIFLSALEPCRTYEIKFMYEGDSEAFYTETIETDCKKKYDEIYREMLLDTKTKKIVPPKKVEPEVEVVLPVVTIKEFPNLSYKHNFDYNGNKLTVRRGDLKDFVKDVEAQLKDGRKMITINVYSSASNVTSRVYESNEELSLLRAENMKYDLLTHFEDKKKFQGRVNVVIVSSVVAGPPYEWDYENEEKYKPYQYVELKTQ